MRFARRPTPLRTPTTFALLLALACATPGRAPAPAASAPGPSLAEVFGEKSLDGLRPTDAAISSDGRFVELATPGLWPTY